jgi:exonuclease SbcC
MKIKKLSLKNIRSYESLDLDFPEGSLLLSGDIGTGKTSILLAIEYAIFGLQPGQKGSALLRNNADFGEVSLNFEVDGNDIIIDRKLKRGKSVSNDYASITVNGEKVESSITEVKTKILKLLGYPPEFVKKTNLLYRYTVYTPQEQMKQIILEDPETRLNIIRHIFGVDRYKRIRENLSTLLIYLKDKIKELHLEIRTLDQEKLILEETKNLIKLLDDKIEKGAFIFLDYTQKRKIIENEIFELESKIKEKEQFEKEVEKTNIQLASKNDNLSSINRELFEITEALSEIKEPFNQQQYSMLNEEIVAKKVLLDDLNSKYIELVSKINSLETGKKENFEKKDRVFNISFCPTCLQNVSYAHKHNILNETESKIVELSKQLESYGIEKDKLRSSIEIEKDTLSKLETQRTLLEILKSKTEYLEKSKRKLAELEKSKISLEKDVLLLSKHIDSLKEEILKFSKFSHSFKKKQEELKNAFLEEKRSEISLAEQKKEKEITLKTISELESKIKEKEVLKTKLNFVLDLNDWISNQFSNLVDFIERNVLMKIRLDFSQLFSEWFKMLVSNEGFDVKLDENFTPLIMQSDIEMDYSFLSGGERTAVALAYRLALNQTINSVLSQIKTRDIVMLDEPTEGFSETQIDKIRDVLEELNAKQLIMVSHEQRIESFVDNIIKLKKETDISNLDSSSRMLQP